MLICRRVIASASLSTRRSLAINAIRLKLLELESPHLNPNAADPDTDLDNNEKSSPFELETAEMDKSLYSRYLTCLSVLNDIPLPPPSHWESSHFIPTWSAEYITKNFYEFTTLDGPIKWLTKDSGNELPLTLAQELMKRANVRGWGCV